MASKIGAVVLFLLGLGLLGLAATGPAAAVSQVRSPSVPWLAELPKPKARPIEAAPAKDAQVAEPTAEPADKPAAEPVPIQALAPAGDEPASDEPASEPAAAAAAPARAEPAVVALEPAKDEPAAAALEPAKDAPAPEPAVVVVEPAKADEKPVETKVAKPEPVPTKATEPAEPKPALLVKKPEPKPTKLAAADPKPEAPPAEPQGMGTLIVSSSPSGAEVFLGGANIGQTPIEIDVPAGVHDLKLVDSSGQSKSEAVKVRQGRMSKVNVAF